MRLALVTKAGMSYIQRKHNERKTFSVTQSGKATGKGMNKNSGKTLLQIRSNPLRVGALKMRLAVAKIAGANPDCTQEITRVIKLIYRTNMQDEHNNQTYNV